MRKLNYYIFLLIPWMLFAQTPITDANFKDAIHSCLSMNPVDGMCSSSEWGAMPNWDVSNVTDMSFGFNYYSLFNGDISAWNVSNVTDMRGMFLGAESFNQDIGSWNVSNVTTMNAMFSAIGPGHPFVAFNQDISAWDVSSVTDMTKMFYGTLFNQDIGSWDIGNVSSTAQMFWASPFDQNIGGWNMSNVSSTTFMFAATPFNQNIGGWNMSSVTSMTGMFWAAGSFNQDISGWDVSNVDSMHGLFYQASSFNQDISDWDVSNVSQMGSMFEDAVAFDQNLGIWNVGNVANMSLMFEGVRLSTSNYDALLAGWASLPSLRSSITFSGGFSTYCNSEAARNTLINTYGWTITDGGLDCTVGLEDPDLSELRLYPNPVDQTLYVSGIEQELNVTVFNIIGKQMITTLTRGELDMRTLPAGLYLLRITDGENTVTKKVIKN